jgi:DNA-binding FadR family transcriptional regulator
MTRPVAARPVAARPVAARPAAPREITAARYEKVSRVLARLIVKDIAERGLQPGSPLPPEQVMAQQYGVGRASVREALRLLESQGLVIIRQGSGGGPVVGAPEGRDFGETLTMYLQIQRIRFKQIIEAMAQMDGLLAGMLAEKVKSGEISDVDELVKVSEQELSGIRTQAAYVDRAVTFHDTMRGLGGNYIIDLTTSAVAHIFNDRTLGVHNHWGVGERDIISKQHRAIARAIQQGNSTRARKLATSHIEDVGKLIVELYPAVLEEIVDWR